MSTFVKLFLAVVVTAAMLEFSQACSCAFSHPQVSYCSKNSLSFSFQVESGSFVDTRGNKDVPVPDPNNGGQGFGFNVKRRYKVKNFRLYRGNNVVTPGTPIKYIYTASNSAACGVGLQLNTFYAVIGGYYNKGRLNIASCNHITVFPTNFNKRIIMFINLIYRYRKACGTEPGDCEAVECRFGGDCTVPRKPNQCYTNALPQALKFDSDFQSICYRQPYYRGCKWLNGFDVVKPVIVLPVGPTKPN